MKKMTKNLLAMSLIIMMITASSSLAVAQSIHICKIENNSKMELKYKAHEIKDVNKIDYDKIISNGDNQLECWKGGRFETIQSKQGLTEYKSLLLKLEEWYDAQPDVEFASLIDTTMTLKFNDESYNLIFLDLPDFSVDESQKNQFFSILDSQFEFSLKNHYTCLPYNDETRTAVVLNPFQWQRGDSPCSEAIKYLKRTGYKDENIIYKENDNVNIDFLKNGGLSANVVFWRGHGGYADLDNDGNGDTVVLASGEEWTDRTENLYEDDINEIRIIRGFNGDSRDPNESDYVTYTPNFISYYYKNFNQFPENSLVFMATCHSGEDGSMARAFLDDAGAGTYIGWKSSIFSWTNKRFSKIAFNMLCLGFSAKSACGFINSMIRMRHSIYKILEIFFPFMYLIANTWAEMKLEYYV